MRSIGETLEQIVGPPIPQEEDEDEGKLITSNSQEDIDRYIEEFNRMHRPESLLEKHQKKRNGKNNLNADQYIFGHKSLENRFKKASGRSISFM